MFDTASTDTLCMLAGGVALGAILCTRSRPPVSYGPSECSARKSEVVEPVSARAAPTEEPSDPSFWPEAELSENFEEQMRTVTKRDNHTSDKVKQAKRDLTPKIAEMELSRNKANGIVIPRIGEYTQPPETKVTGGCMFYMSDAYSQKMESMEKTE